MIGEDADSVAALKVFLEDGVRVLSDAAERLADGPLSPQAYQELAEGCNALGTALGTRAEHGRRADQSRKDRSEDGGLHGVRGVQVFAICGSYRFRDRRFPAYGLEFVGDRGGAVLAIPARVRWRWSRRRVFAVRGRSAEEILGKLIPMVNVRLVRLGPAPAGPVGHDGQPPAFDKDANVNGEMGSP
jgi:hypothetical protein